MTVEMGTVTFDEIMVRIGEYAFNEDMYFKLMGFAQTYTRDEDGLVFISDLLGLLRDVAKDCESCEYVDLESVECYNCPNYDEIMCVGCQGNKVSIEKAYEKRTLFIRFLQFPYRMNLDLVNMSNGLSDKDFIDRILRYLSGLKNIYGDMSPVDGCGDDDEDSSNYWKEQCHQLENELEDTRCNHEDDYDEKIINCEEQKKRINYLNDRFDFFVNAVKNNISFIVPFYVIKRDTDVVAIYLTNGEAIDRAASLNAGIGIDDHNIFKMTLIDLCENVTNSDKTRIVYKMLEDKFNYNDEQINNDENIIAIRQKFFDK